MSEQEQETALPGATRSQHVVLQGPADAHTMEAALRPGIERSRGAGADAAPACLIICRDIHAVRMATAQAAKMLGPDGGRVVPVTGVTRARRVLASAPVAVVAGTAADLLKLRQDSALDFGQIQVMVFLGLDQLLEGSSENEAPSAASPNAAPTTRATIQALLGDSPSECMRIATIATETEAVQGFLEAQLRRPRRIALQPAPAVALPVVPRYLLTSAAGRSEALRVILDEEDPPSVTVVADSEPSLQEATSALHELGVIVDGLHVQVTREPSAQHVALTVLWNLPVSAEAMSAALSARPAQAIALILPQELETLRQYSHGEAQAWLPAERKSRALSRAETVRTAVRKTLKGMPATSGELALITPLLDEYDAVEIAAAALRLFERATQAPPAVQETTRHAKAAPAAVRSEHRIEEGARQRSSEPSGPSESAGGNQRLFVAVGKRDGVRVGDIVGAIANEAGVPGERIGQVDLFESHAIIELNATDLAAAVSALSGSSLRGRRLNAKVDNRGGERREGRSEGRGFGRGDSRGGSRGDSRGGGRGEGRGGFRSEGRGEGRGGFRGEGRGERSGGSRFGARSGPSRSWGSDSDRGDRGGRGGFSRSGAGRGGSDRGGSHSGPFERDRFARTNEERRSFGDRPARERVEGRQEWADRADRLKHSKRAVRPRPDRSHDFDDE